MSEKSRLDVHLVEKGLAQSRTHAQELIESEQVFLVQGTQKKVLKKSSFAVTADMFIEVTSGPANRFVSRGGLKLEGALEHLKLSVAGKKALDVGISTGGFTDCLLKNGAEFVLGVDVGHGQVHPSLLSDPKLKVIEGINARGLSQDSTVAAAVPKEKFDLIVMDVSFISISLIIPELIGFLKTEGCLLSLVKPQFEVGVDGLAKGGIVKDASLFKDVENKIKKICLEQNLKVLDYFSSPIQGKDGNNEFFIFAQK
ncbi:TlyA family RNA methyltransferase [Bdellovibrio reynosensis]|uniref:TlyA family RNA methyltransferase n=1 Tax=Bdellovibrio reynosensis TaxID=2835041 RepID=A0ABY4C5U6_9BACT|nr:TlyA family RNA methyltransferase [Bdellovibrio reynosensis]UOF00243.1 TlyA family RNA methyltransferase [Bdellovibrio reynosensis]